MATFTSSTFLGGAGRFDYNEAGTQSWATARGAAASTITGATYEVEAENSAGDHRIQRVMLPIDTSSIPANATITAVTLNFTANYEGGYSSTVVHLIKTTQASPSSRDVNDYNNVEFTSGGSVATNNATPTAKTITGNATSLGWIVKGGTTLIGLISDADLTNTAPGTNHWCTITSPELVVTYSLAGGNFLAFM